MEPYVHRDIQHKSAIRRGDFSRLVKCLLRDGLLGKDVTFFDYGCGRGEDLKLLSSDGFTCSGWDPAFQPDVARQDADVVNLGYVINVIEKPDERAETLPVRAVPSGDGGCSSGTHTGPMFMLLEESERIEMSRRERDRLKVLHGVIEGERLQKEAARLLRLTTLQVRRLLQRLQEQGDQGLIHRLRGQPSNRSAPAELRQRVLAEYRQSYQGFGPTFACEKLAAQGLEVSHDTLRRWLIAEGLWQGQRKREKHRQRRPRRACFGELVQMDTSIHDWLEGRGEAMVLVAMIDDATGRIEAGFYSGETVQAHFDLLGRWLRKNGRPIMMGLQYHSTPKVRHTT